MPEEISTDANAGLDPNARKKKGSQADTDDEGSRPIPIMTWYILGGRRKPPTLSRLWEMAEERRRVVARRGEEKQAFAEASRRAKDDLGQAEAQLKKMKEEHEKAVQEAEEALGKARREYKQRFGKGVKGWKEFEEKGKEKDLGKGQQKEDLKNSGDEAEADQGGEGRGEDGTTENIGDHVGGDGEVDATTDGQAERRSHQEEDKEYVYDDGVGDGPGSGGQDTDGRCMMSGAR